MRHEDDGGAEAVDDEAQQARDALGVLLVEVAGRLVGEDEARRGLWL